jgi:hypothetical protein
MSVQKIDSDGVPMVRVVGIASDFTDLDDVPGSYTSHANEILQVNASEDALAFTSVGSLAGNIDHGNLAGLSTGADHSYIDQDVTSGSSPTFDGTNFTGIPNGALDETYINADGTVSLSANWDIGDGYRIEADEIRARDGAGLKLYDDGGNGIFVEDGGQVGIGTTSPGKLLEVGGSAIFNTNSGSDPMYISRATGQTGQSAKHYVNDSTYFIETIQDENIVGGGTLSSNYGSVLMRIGNSSGQHPHFAVSDYRSGSDVGVFKVEADGNVGIGNTDPDTILHAADETATTDAILDIARIEAQCSGTVSDGFGAGLEFELETNGGQDVAAVLAATWEDATHATRQSQLELWTNYQGNEVLSGVIVAPSNTSADGNARGVGAVDLQGYRSATTEVASGNYSVVAGGYENTANASYATVGGGISNTASGVDATVVGGLNNTASGLNAVVAGGYGNTADGDYSFAAGREADTNSYDGVFIWADSWDDSESDYTADRDNQFKIRCDGGLFVNYNDSWTAEFYDDGTDVLSITDGTVTAHLTDDGAWTDDSLRSHKENFQPVWGDLLDKVRKLPVELWNMHDSNTLRCGPCSDEFYDIFGLGYNDGIKAGDAAGVALAAIQMLYDRVQALENQIA